MEIKEILKKCKKKRVIIPLVIALVVGEICINNIKSNQIHYQTQKLERCTITQVVEASGTINPVNTVSVGSTVSGLMKAIYVDYNSEVKKGQLLAQIDPANFQASVDQNRAQINNAVGQPVAASFQAPELFTIAQDLKKMQIEVNVSEADIGQVKEGQDVEYTLDGYPDSTFYGKVTQVRLDSTTTSNVVTYTVIVSVSNDDLKLKPGMTANVSIITNRSSNVLCAPTIALKYSPETSGQKYKNQGIWILDDGKPRRIDIKEGASDDTNVEIISKRVKVGDSVIVGSIGGKAKQSSASGGNDKRRGGPPGMF